MKKRFDPDKEDPREKRNRFKKDIKPKKKFTFDRKDNHERSDSSSKNHDEFKPKKKFTFDRKDNDRDARPVSTDRNRESDQSRDRRGRDRSRDRDWEAPRDKRDKFKKDYKPKKIITIDTTDREKDSEMPYSEYKKGIMQRNRKKVLELKDYQTRYERNKEAGDIRLNKYIANSGICSRREADKLIENGEIKVNGAVVREMGVKVKINDVIEYNGKRLTGEELVYVLLNKPKDYITTTKDPEGRKTVLDLITGIDNARVFPVGRLDRNTTGLILLTNDGELAAKLIHPRYKVQKIYQVELDKPLTKADMEKIMEGVELEDGKALVDDIAYVKDNLNKRVIGIELHSGKNRIVRRIFESLEYDIVKLDRVSFAGLTKKNLPRGSWRILEEKEVFFLKNKFGR